MLTQKTIYTIWTEKIWNDYFQKNYWLNWYEKGIGDLFFYYLKSKINENNLLAVLEYSPFIVNRAWCDEKSHQKINESFVKHDNIDKMNLDLCVLRFDDKIKRITNECTYWCFNHKPIIAMEFKYNSIRELKRPKKSGMNKLENDIERLKIMYSRKHTKGYFCVLTDKPLDILNLCDEYRGNHSKQIKILYGSWIEDAEWGMI